MTFFILSLLSAVLLSAGFLFPHCGGFALFAFVPLLIMDRMASQQKVKHFFWWHYLTFLMWNLFTTFWVCNATFAGGLAASVVNALLMSAIWSLFRLFKTRFGKALPYLFLASMWVAWERFYFDAEISWPWLTLGNAFAYSTTCIQWYDITGTLGGSLWIWACNLAIFGILTTTAEGKWNSLNKKARYAAAAGTIALIAGPLTFSWIKYATFEENTAEGSLDVCLLQPNLDPYEKFESLSQAQQNGILLDLIREYDKQYTLANGQAADSLHPILYLAPETATDDIILNELNNSETLFAFKKEFADKPNANILFGASSYQFFWQEKAPSYTARQLRNGAWYENYNSAIMSDGTPRTEIYHKSRLVIGTEKMPWPRVFSKIEKALGGNIMGHCIGQSEVSLLNFVCNDTTGIKAAGMPAGKVPLGCAVCYESVYPEYFASYIGKGAKAMTVITNDAWWGDTPGYKQHLRYSCLRAIETRRDIARCANTGISAFINQRGDIVSCTNWDERCFHAGRINFNSGESFYVRHPDMTGRLCTFIFLLMIFALGVNLTTLKKSGRIR